MSKWLLVYAIFFGQTVCAQFRDPVSAGFLGSGAYNKKSPDVFSFTVNSAALAQVKCAYAGVYGESRFRLEGLQLFKGVVAVPAANGVIGFKVDQFGFKNYKESQIGLSYARHLGPSLDLGTSFKYFNLRIPGYGSASSINFELGFIAHISENVNVGFSASDPVGGVIGKSGQEHLRAVYRFGVGYDASDVFCVSGEIVKEEDLPMDVNVGLRYNFKKRFFACAGIHAALSIAYCGAGYTWGKFRLDISGSYHPSLGFSPGLMLIISINKEKK